MIFKCIRFVMQRKTTINLLLWIRAFNREELLKNIDQIIIRDRLADFGKYPVGSRQLGRTLQAALQDIRCVLKFPEIDKHLRSRNQCRWIIWIGAERLFEKAHCMHIAIEIAQLRGDRKKKGDANSPEIVQAFREL